MQILVIISGNSGYEALFIIKLLFMKNFYITLLCFYTTFSACSKEKPAVNSSNTGGGVIVPPPPPPPPNPFSTNCAGYWICVSNIGFRNLFYTSAGLNWPGAYGAVAVTSDRIFYAGGHDEGHYGGPLSTIYIYNPSQNKWVSNYYLSEARSRLSGITVGNKVLFAGGNNSRATYPVYSAINWSYSNVVDIFDANSMTQTVASLSEARAYMVAVSCNNKAWFIGGKNNTRYSDRIDIYDPGANSWAQVSLPRPRAHAGATVIGNKIFIAGGKNETGNLTIVDVYDASSNQWSTLSAPNEHPYASVVSLNNKIFIAGGDGELNKSVDVYNTISGTWSTGQLSNSRFDMAVGVANNKIVYMAGNYSPVIDVYNDLTGTWTTGSAGNNSGMVCGTLNDRCYFAGFLGQDGNTSIGTMIIIEP